MASPFPRRPGPPSTPKNNITIPLPSRPADYTPNSGPPLLRLSIVPPSDSTAYIDDRILLPPAGVAADGRPLPKRMKYIIGWRDLPAARLLVSAMDVLDYVSPRALEEWEYSMELELDAERARLAAEREALKTHAQQQGLASELPKSKRLGRPPLHHTKIEAAVVAEAEDTDGEQARPRGGAMSLSTPKKRKMEDFLDGYTSDESPSEQLLSDLARSTGHALPSPKEDAQDAGLPHVHSASIAPLVPAAIDDDDRYPGVESQFFKNRKLTTSMTRPFMPGSATAKPEAELLKTPAMAFPPAKDLSRRPTTDPATQAKTQSSRPITDYLSTARNDAGIARALKPKVSSKVPPEPQVGKAQPRQPANPKQLSALARKYSGMSKTPTQRVLSKVPSKPQLEKAHPRQSAAASSYTGTSRPPAPRISNKVQRVPQLDKDQSRQQTKSQHLSTASQNYDGTPKPPTHRIPSKVQTVPQLDKDQPRQQAKSKHSSSAAQNYDGLPQPPTHRVSSKVALEPQPNQTKPRSQADLKHLSAAAGKYNGTSQPLVPRSLDRLLPRPQLDTAQPRSQAKAKYRPHVAQKKISQPPVRKPSTVKARKPPRMPVFVDSSSDSDSDDEDKSWTVDRLEDLELFEVEGEGLVRFFKVRWEGDWPPDQNPTWEPEQNIDPEMVAEFCRTFKGRGGAKTSSSSSSEPRKIESDAGGEDVLPLPPLKRTVDSGVQDDDARPSSAHSGLFVYSSDDGMEKHVWDAPNSQGLRPNLNGVFPARMA